MNLNRRLEPLPELEIGLRKRHEILLLAAVLIVGLTFVSPALSLLSGVPALVFVVIVGAVYGALSVLFRRVLAGSLIGLIVPSTFAANVPLVSHARILTFPAHIGPQLWLVQVPLVVSVVLVVLTGPREVLSGATKSEGLFAAFVGWTLLAAVFGATARVDTALYFSLLMAQGLVAFVLLRYAVQREILSFGAVVRVFVGTVLAQSLFAVAQFLNGGIFGVSTLGEYDGSYIATLSLGPLGEFAIGTHVAGFTGMSFILASLIVLAAPMAFVLALRGSGWTRAAFLATALVMLAVLRVTGTDAGRGALILALVCLCAALVYTNRIALLDRLTGARSSRMSARAVTAITAVLTVLVSIVVLFFPSSASGTGSSITDIDGESASPGASGGSTGSSGDSSGSSGGAGGGSTGGSTGAGSSGAGGESAGGSTSVGPGGGGGSVGGGGSGAANTRPELVESVLDGLSIPFFDIGNLGIRLIQYVAGIDLFVQYPLFGIGGANFIYYATEYGLPKPLPLHNIYIALLAETGLPGFLLFITLVGSVLWYGSKAATRTSGGLLCVGLLCGMIGYLAFGFWDTLPLTQVPSFFAFWILAGTVVGTYSHRER